LNARRARGSAKPRRGGAARGEDARVVWPPRERQPARSAIAELMRERRLPRGFERHVERDARRARDRGLDVRGDR
jgi:hypothetical protein